MINTRSISRKPHSRLFKIQVMECVLVYVLLILSYGIAGLLIYRTFFPFGLFTSNLDFYLLSGLMVALLSYYKFFRFLDMPYAEVAKKVVFVSILVNTLLILLLYFFEGERVSIYYFVVAYVLQIMFLVMIKLFSGLFKKKTLQEGLSLVVVQDDHANVLIRALKKQCIGKVALVSPEDPKLEEYADQASNIYLTGSVTQELKKHLIDYCAKENKQVYLVPEVFEIVVGNSHSTHIGDTPVFEIGTFQLTEAQSLIKRVGDIVLSILGIAITWPIMLIAIIGIKKEDGGPVFFRQERCGIHGQTFNVIKFRSMVPDAEKHTGAVLAEENDPRITKIGRFMRATRIDEIPQFFNVLAGSMSIVGPRPERPVFVENYKKDYPEYCHRLSVKPGITGLAQVMGNYTTTAEDKMKFDLMYVINYSVLTDIKIMLQTLKVIFTREQAEGFSQEDRTCSFDMDKVSRCVYIESCSVKKSLRVVKEVVFFCLCIVIALGTTFYRYDEIASDIFRITTEIVEYDRIMTREERILEVSVLAVQGIANPSQIDYTIDGIRTINNRFLAAYNLYTKLNYDELIFLEQLPENGCTEEEIDAVLDIVRKYFLP